MLKLLMLVTCMGAVYFIMRDPYFGVDNIEMVGVVLLSFILYAIFSVIISGVALENGAQTKMERVK